MHCPTKFQSRLQKMALAQYELPRRFARGPEKKKNNVALAESPFPRESVLAKAEAVGLRFTPG
jgi:hypothetical protein